MKPTRVLGSPELRGGRRDSQQRREPPAETPPGRQDAAALRSDRSGPGPIAASGEQVRQLRLLVDSAAVKSLT